MGSSTKTTDTTPWAPAQPYILSGLKSTQDVFDQNQAGLQDTSAQLKQGFNALAPTAFGANPLQDQTESALSDTIGGKYLAANPYLTGIMNTTNANITNDVNGQFETGGRYGSANHAGILAEKIGDADNSLQYQNYNDERARQQAAIGMDPSIQAARYTGVSPLLALAQGASSIPYTGVDALNSNVKTASGGYNTSTTTSTPSLADDLTGAAGLGLKAYSSGIFGSDARLKDVSSVAGVTPDGLPLVNYTLSADPTNTPQTGVIAQDVAQVRPDALGPTGPRGMMSVDYSKLGLPDPTTLASQFHPDAQPQQFPFTPSFDPGAAAPAAPVASTLPSGNPTPPTGLLNAPDVTSQALPTIKGPSFGDRFFNPDSSTTQGKAGLLADYLLAGSSLTAPLGKGLIGMREDAATQAAAAQKSALEAAQIAQATRTANKPTLTTLGNDLYSTPADGGPSVKVASGTPKTAEAPFGIVPDPTTGGYKALPGFETPADKAKRESQDASDKSDAADARQAKAFAHSDAMQARSLAAIAARMGAGATSAPLPDTTVDYMAQRYLVDGTLPQLGMGKASAGMKSQIINRAVELAGQAGQTGADGVAAKAGYAGQVAGQRALGTRSANINLAAEEASQTFPLARQASANIARTGFVPLTQVEQMIQRGNNNPDLAAFNAANQAVITSYSRAMSPTGVPTVNGSEHARALLSTAMNPTAYNAVLDQMQREIGVAKNSVATVRGNMTSQIAGRPVAAPAAPPMKGTVVKGYKFMGGDPASPRSWQKAA